MFRKLFSVFILLSACTAYAEQPNGSPTPCSSKEACLNDPNCYCWCSVKCGWRKKTAQDRPVYIENDPYGKHCYCKQWDYDHYEDNCIKGKNIPQPPNSK